MPAKGFYQSLNYVKFRVVYDLIKSYFYVIQQAVFRPSLKFFIKYGNIPMNKIYDFNNIFKKAKVLLLFFLLPGFLYSQPTPSVGGVYNANNKVLWLKAENITPEAGNLVGLWHPDGNLCGVPCLRVPYPNGDDLGS